MELKEKNTEVLKSDFKKGKRLIQTLTAVLLILFGFFMYSLFTSKEHNTSYSLIIMALGMIVIFYDRKVKKIKAELDSRE